MRHSAPPGPAAKAQGGSTDAAPGPASAINTRWRGVMGRDGEFRHGATATVGSPVWGPSALVRSRPAGRARSIGSERSDGLTLTTAPAAGTWLAPPGRPIAFVWLGVWLRLPATAIQLKQTREAARASSTPSCSPRCSQSRSSPATGTASLFSTARPTRNACARSICPAAVRRSPRATTITDAGGASPSARDSTITVAVQAGGFAIVQR